MKSDVLTQGSVIIYPFLWSREAERGETEGRKRIPDCKIGEISSRVFAEIWQAFLTALPRAKRVKRYE